MGTRILQFTSDFVRGWLIFALVFGGLGALACAIGAVFGLWGFIHPDGTGQAVWASFHDTPTFIDGDWIVGEYRECGMLRYQQDGTSGPGANSDSIPLLFCYSGTQLGSSADDAPVDGEQGAHSVAPNSTSCVRGEQTLAMLQLMNGTLPSQAHELSVKFFGDWKRTDTTCSVWHCQREEKSLICHSLDR